MAVLLSAALLAVLVMVVAVPSAVHAVTRQYYIQAEVVNKWNYAPSGRNLLNGWSLDVMQPMNVGSGLVGRELMHQPTQWTKAGPDRVGREYVKAVLREYTDATFTTRKTRPNDEAHLGILGPTMRAVVGDTIQIVFKNNIPTGAGAPNGRQANLGFSLHPHGVFYQRPSEGAPYLSNNTIVTVPGTQQRREKLEKTTLSDSEMHAELGRMADERLRAEKQRRAGVHISTGGGSNIKYGESFNYTWDVPARAGPGPNDKSSIAWLYHSHTDEAADTNAALTGVIIVTRPEDADAVTAKPSDVDREIVTLFSIIDEISSPFAVENTFPLPAVQNNMTKYMMLTMNLMFQDSQRMKNINGYVYGNLPGTYMYEGERVRWYVGTLGDEKDVHGAHWHGNTLLLQNQRVDSIPLVPAVLVSADMVPDNVGQWMFHCHTNHHIHGGMTGLYEVLPCAPNCATTPPASSKCPTAADCVAACGTGNVVACACPEGQASIQCGTNAPSSEETSSAERTTLSAAAVLLLLVGVFFV